MKRWGLRHKGYKVAFMGVVGCSFFFLVGFASPAWQNSRGLWMDCSVNGEFRMCISHNSPSNQGSIPAFLEAVRACECLALISLALCIVSEVYLDFLSRPSPDRRLVELFALLGGTCGVVGSIIFAAFTPLSSEIYLSWAYALASAASCLIIMFACFIAYFRRKGLDVRNYAASNAIQYRPSVGVILPPTFNSMDLAPPPYSEVVGQPPTSQAGGSGYTPHEGRFKPVIFGDCAPPPAYYPPPPSGHFQAPPPYEPSPSSTSQPVTSSSGPTRVNNRGGGESALTALHHTELNTEAGDDRAGRSNTAHTSNPTPADSTTDAGVGVGVEPPADLPVYYVTVLGQAVPVFREELQQAGMNVPLSQNTTTTTPVPAYFIEMQGHHVPVYSEEQARALSAQF